MNSRIKGGIPSPTAREDFIAGAPSKSTYPWKDPALRDDVGLQLNVKLPERLMHQLGWVSFHTKRTKVEIVKDALEIYLKRELLAMGAEAD